MHLPDFLIGEYEKQGWSVCRDFYQNGAGLPENWVGPYPDLIAVKENRRLAICIESSSTLTGDFLPKKWQSILRNPGFSLLVVVRDKASRELALRTANHHGIVIECRIIRRSVHRERLAHDDFFRKRFRLFAIVLGLVFVFITVFMILPSVRKSFKTNMERQIHPSSGSRDQIR